MAKRQNKESMIEQRHYQAPDTRESFDSWWARFQARYGVTKDLKESVMLHAKARGLWDGMEWRKVAEDFGYDVRGMQ